MIPFKFCALWNKIKQAQLEKMKRKISKKNSLYLSSFQSPPYNDKKKATAKQKKMSHDAEIERKKKLDLRPNKRTLKISSQTLLTSAEEKQKERKK